MKKLVAFIFGLFLSLSFYADARLVSGTASHQHDSATGGGSSISGTTATNLTLLNTTQNKGTIISHETVVSGNPTTIELYPTGEIRPGLSFRAHNSGAGNYGVLIGGGRHNGTDYTAGTTTANLLLLNSPGTGDSIFYANTALTAGSAYTPTERFRIKADGSITSTKACSAGYVRIGPNLCMNNSSEVYTALVRDTCTNIAVPTGALAILIHYELTVSSGNAVGTRYSQVEQFISSDCTNRKVDSQVLYYEFNATVAGTLIGFSRTSTMLEPGDGGGYYLRFGDDTGNQGAAKYMLLGYYD